MAKTASERQKDYRNRRSMAGDNGERRINTWVTTAAALALKRLAARYGVTHREMLEKLILEADDKVCRAIDDDDTVAWNTYFEANSLRRNKAADVPGNTKF